MKQTSFWKHALKNYSPSISCFHPAILFWVFLIGLFYTTPAQSEEAIFQVKNFEKKVYRASNQNWSVATSPNGSVYFANHWGLLEFDGISWDLHRLPNQTILRSVLVASDSLIYTSGYRELGYWTVGKSNTYQYHSLNHLAEKYFSNNEESWSITSLNGSVYFHSYSKIYRFTNDSIIPIPAPGMIGTQHHIGNKILVVIQNWGIYSIEGNELKPYITNDFFQNKIVRFVLPYKENQLMIGTNLDGIWIWDGKQFSEWNPGWTEYFRKNELNRAILTNNGKLVFGTILDGVSVFDTSGKLITQYNTSNGLQNNTVLGIAEDKFNNVWFALDSGIDFLSSHTTPGFSIEFIPGIGSVYDAAELNGKTYLATNQGLFYKQNDQSDNNYHLVSKTQGHIWDCEILDNHLLVGHNNGIMLVDDNRAQTISPQSGGFCIKKDPMRPDYYIESTYSNMINLKKQGNTVVQKGVIHGFSDLIRYIEVDHLGHIWASHMHRGVYKLLMNNHRDTIVSKTYYGANSVFQQDHSIHVFKIENRIVFTTEKMLFTYDDLNDSIIPYKLLNEKLGDFSVAHRIVEAPDHHYWMITKTKIGLFQIYNNEVTLIKSYPRSLFAVNQLIDNYENIVPLSASKAIICLENGIARIDASLNSTGSEIADFMPQPKEIKLTDRHGKTEKRDQEEGSLLIKYKYNNIRIRYSFPHFTHDPIYFRSYMKGLDQNWSPSTEMPDFSFDRLPTGEYELQVKAIDQWGNESLIHSIQIKVAPPWYASRYARVGYILSFIIFLFGFQAWAISKTRKKERIQLEKREKELIRLRNQNLRTEIEHKSKELANSTIAMVKKNEFLMELKEIVQNQKEQLGARFPDKYYSSLVEKIDMNISSKDDWKLFETNFERAHEQFLSKLKEQFDDLTPGDLKLCAFLRMNLSSKEIAPLLGISVRGVENHRYRLRKKLELDSDDNLTDYLMHLS